MTTPVPTLDTMLLLYGDGPRDLEAAIAGVTESELDEAPAEGSWSIRQIIHHIVDGDDIWKIALKVALGNCQRVFSFQWYWDIPQVEWAQKWDYNRREIEPSLELFRANRKHMVQLLSHRPDAWDQTIPFQWPDEEACLLAISSIIQMQVNHVEGHINDICAIREALRERQQRSS